MTRAQAEALLAYVDAAIKGATWTGAARAAFLATVEAAAAPPQLQQHPPGRAGLLHGEGGDGRVACGVTGVLVALLPADVTCPGCQAHPDPVPVAPGSPPRRS